MGLEEHLEIQPPLQLLQCLEILLLQVEEDYLQEVLLHSELVEAHHYLELERLSHQFLDLVLPKHQHLVLHLPQLLELLNQRLELLEVVYLATFQQIHQQAQDSLEMHQHRLLQVGGYLDKQNRHLGLPLQPLLLEQQLILEEDCLVLIHHNLKEDFLVVLQNLHLEVYLDKTLQASQQQGDCLEQVNQQVLLDLDQQRQLLQHLDSQNQEVCLELLTLHQWEVDSLEQLPLHNHLYSVNSLRPRDHCLEVHSLKLLKFKLFQFSNTLQLLTKTPMEFQNSQQRERRENTSF